MTIPEFKQRTTRLRIGILGTLAAEGRRALERRGFDCYLASLAAMPDEVTLNTTDCLIIVQAVGRSVRKHLEACTRALSFDCRVYVQRAGDSASVRLAEESVANVTAPVLDSASGAEVRPAVFDRSCFDRSPEPQFGPCVHMFAAETEDAWEAFANLVAQNPAGPPANLGLSIVGDGATELTPEQRLLFFRAFSDCREIRLIKKSNGLSGIATFEIHAHLGSNEVGGDWPARFFVKVGVRSTVEREYLKYRTTAMEHVPFHLGPRLRVDRCCMAATQGLIVSDYVSGAEALRDCAREGRGSTAIANLFNQTLWAWRRGATEERRSLGEALLARLNCEHPQHRRHRYSQLGSRSTVGQLRSLFSQCTSSPVLTGVVHGDLHATNVLVRQDDAVIIDLEKVESGYPLLFDAASLEGGLLIDGFIKGDTRAVSDVLSSILPLYERRAFCDDDHFCDPHLPSHWFFDSVRQIRMQARQLERGGPNAFQYAWTLAAILIRKSCNKDDFTLMHGQSREVGERREEIRAMAYVVAEKILRELVTPPAQQEGASE